MNICHTLYRFQRILYDIWLLSNQVDVNVVQTSFQNAGTINSTFKPQSQHTFLGMAESAVCVSAMRMYSCMYVYEPSAQIFQISRHHHISPLPPCPPQSNKMQINKQCLKIVWHRFDTDEFVGLDLVYCLAFTLQIPIHSSSVSHGSWLSVCVGGKIVIIPTSVLLLFRTQLYCLLVLGCY